MDDPDPAVIGAKRWSAKIDAADAFIFVTPEHNQGAPRSEQAPSDQSMLAALKYSERECPVTSLRGNRRSFGSARCELLGLDFNVLVGVLREHVERRIGATRQRELRFGTGDLRGGLLGWIAHDSRLLAVAIC
jgi:hypothetical protein